MYDYELGTFSDPVYSFQMMRLLVPHMESLLQVYEGKIVFCKFKLLLSLVTVFIVVGMLSKYFYIRSYGHGRSVESDVVV